MVIKMSEQLYCIFDYETYSEVPLKTAGAYEYARHPSTEIICFAWCVGTKDTLLSAKTKGMAPSTKGLIKQSFINCLFDPEIIFVAHNAFFEQMITRYVLPRYFQIELPDVPARRFICTASLASTLALPRSLEGAADALRLDIRKDMEGAKLLKKMMKPAKVTKNNPNPRRFRDDPANILRLLEYCKTDVEAETLLFLKAPPLQPTERKIWLLDQEINSRGFAVDRPMIKKVLGLIDEETKALDEETENLTLGYLASAKQRDGVLNWLTNEKTFLPDLKRKTVEDALADGLVEGDSRRLLEMRLAVSKSSTAKYQKLEMSSRSTGRVYDTLLYHAASTGRWGGARVQPQNFPRPHLKFSTLQSMIDVVKDKKDKSETSKLDWIRMVDDNPMQCFASMLRSMIIVPPGETLDVADYNAIEARVLFWLADHEKGLKAFREKRPIYEELASKIFRIPVDEIGEDSLERFVGKTATLGAGYGMGAPKFQTTCFEQGKVEISLTTAKLAIETFREQNKPVVQLWYNTENAALAAMAKKHKKYTVNHCTWYQWSEFLCCQLPSGRILYFPSPMVGLTRTPWGEKKPTLYYCGVDVSRKKFILQKSYGGKLVENISQGMARDVMASAMLRIKRAGHWKIILSVHDELLAERKLFSGGSIDEYIRLMEVVPKWAPGLPLYVKGWTGTRYRK